MILHINAINLNDGIPDSNGALWYATEWNGWDSPEVRSEAIPRPGQHGAVSVEGVYSERLIDVTGLCKAPSEAAFYQSWYYLSAQTNYMGRNSFVFSVEEDVHRRCLVRRAGKLRQTLVGVGSFTFTVTMRADDPMKYSVTEKSNALNAGVPEVLANDGTMRTYPRIQLDATGTPVITVGALTWQATASLPSGTIIDMQPKTVLNGSTDLFENVDLSSEWVWLEPGNNTVESSVPCTVYWRDAWL